MVRNIVRQMYMKNREPGMRAENRPLTPQEVWFSSISTYLAVFAKGNAASIVEAVFPDPRLHGEAREVGAIGGVGRLSARVIDVAG